MRLLSFNRIIKFAILGLILLSLTPLLAVLVQPEQAIQAARAYLTENSGAKQLSLGEAQIHTYNNGSLYQFDKKQNADVITPLYFIVFADRNYALMAADDNAYPVLAYSLEGMTVANNLPPAFYWWMDNYSGYVNKIIQDKSILPENQAVWSALLNSSYRNDTKQDRSVVPLVSTMWNQDWPYNALCPADPAGPGGHVYAGCVATAMGMVMKYWNHPQTGSGNHSYYAPGYGYQNANFGNTTYLWDEMPDAVGADYIPTATFLYHCGVSVNMGYAPDGSGAQSTDAAAAMVNYFNYPTAQYVSRDSYNQTTWNALMTAQIDNGTPVYYSGYSTGGGHAFVLDGYDTANHFHFNFGWGGSSNGYFNTTNINGFTDWQGAIINTIPANYSISTIPVKLTAPSATVGDNFSLQVKTNPLLGSWNINHYDMQLYYDEAAVNYNGFSIDGTISAGGDVIVTETTPGVISVNWNRSTILAGGGTLIKFNFAAIEQGDYLFDLLSMNYNSTPVTNTSFIMVNAVAPVATLAQSSISLSNMMHLTYQAIGSSDLSTTYLLPSWNVTHYQGNVTYNPEKLEFVSLDLVGTLSANLNPVATVNTPGNLMLSCDTTSPIIGSGALVKLLFRAIGNGSSIAVTQIVPSGFYYNETPITNLTPANVILSAYSSNEDEVAVIAPQLQVFPNPAKGLLKMKFSSQSAEPVTYSIYNLKGQLVRSIIFSGVSNKSVSEWDAKDKHGNTVSNGIYFINWQQGNNKGFNKVLMLK